MTKKFVSSPDDDKNWKRFVNSSSILEKLTPIDIRQDGEPLPAELTTDYVTDMNSLKNCLTPVAFKRLHARYRKFKHRSSTGMTTITLHKNTLARLKAFAADNGLNTDNLDELIEIIIDPENRHEVYQNSSNPELQSALSIERQFRITQAKLMLRPHTWGIVMSMMRSAFSAGWFACKNLKAKRTLDMLKQAEDEYIFDIQHHDLS